MDHIGTVTDDIAKQKAFTDTWPETELDVVESLEFELTEAEFSEYGKRAAKLTQHVSDLEAKLDKLKKSAKREIEGIEAEVSQLLETIRTGKEERTVTCVVRKNFKENVIEYLFKGKLMKQRPMQANERQLTMRESRLSQGRLPYKDDALDDEA
jgi:hypothetical protein